MNKNIDNEDLLEPLLGEDEGQYGSIDSTELTQSTHHGLTQSTDRDGDKLPPAPWKPSDVRWNDIMHFVGPGWLVCIAYIDPGNYQANIQAAAVSRYSLLWTVWWTSLFSLYAQALCCRLAYYGQVTLAEAQARDLSHGYLNYLRYFNWFIAEFTVIVTDLPEVIGIGVAFNVFFGWPFYAGILLSTITTFAFLTTLARGMKFVEYIVVFFVGIMSIVLFVEMSITGVDGGELMKGWVYGFVDTEVGDIFAIIGIVGAVIMPHNLYLHTASLQSRPVQREENIVEKAAKYSSWEPLLPVLFTFFISMAVVAVAAQDVYGQPGSTDITFGLSNFCTFLSSRTSCILYGVALLCAGQSSAITTTYAGQYIMDGFLRIRLPTATRAILTRAIAVVPCISFAAAYPDGLALNAMVNWVNALLGFLLPFALTPLIKYTSSEVYMGKYAAGGLERHLMYFLGFAVYLINAVSLSLPGGGFFGDAIRSSEGGRRTWLILLSVVVQAFYLAWNAHCILTPVTRPMMPIGRARPWKEGEFAEVM